VLVFSKHFALGSSLYIVAEVYVINVLLQYITTSIVCNVIIARFAVWF